jgi:hypothetical protein
MTLGLPGLAYAPCELQCGIREFWSEDQWENAANIAYLESNYNVFAVADTRDPDHPCGSHIRTVDGVVVSAELSVGYFQINACNFPLWEWQRLYNARHNCGTAHMIYDQQGWGAWYFSAKRLGLI